MKGYVLDLGSTSTLLRLLSDPTRMRLLALLEREERLFAWRELRRSIAAGR